MRLGIDVSEHQAGLDLSALPLDFAILRTTDGTYRDRAFEQLLEGAGDLPVATYHFLRAPYEGTSIAEQVDAALDVLDGRRFPMWIDVESPAGLTLIDVQRCTAAFLSAGVEVAGVYTNARYWRRHMRSGRSGQRMADPSAFGALWLAEWRDNPVVELPGAPGGLPDQLPAAADWPSPLGFPSPALWQFTSRGRIGAIDVDLTLAR